MIVETVETVEGRVVRYSDRPISFETFLELTGEDDNMELVDGVMVGKMAAQLGHEKLYAWLFPILRLFVEKRGLGIVLGSRTAVEINVFGGRLPDILFVGRERLDIVREKGVYGAPDLVIELVSPNDRPTDIVNLETDYRSIGVPEIVFVDRQKRWVRVLRQRGAEYVEEELMAGPLHLESVEGFAVQVEWLLTEPRPEAFDTLVGLLSAAADTGAAG